METKHKRTQPHILRKESHISHTQKKQERKQGHQMNQQQPRTQKGTTTTTSTTTTQQYQNTISNYLNTTEIPTKYTHNEGHSNSNNDKECSRNNNTTTITTKIQTYGDKSNRKNIQHNTDTPQTSSEQKRNNGQLPKMTTIKPLQQ